MKIFMFDLQQRCRHSDCSLLDRIEPILSLPRHLHSCTLLGIRHCWDVFIKSGIGIHGDIVQRVTPVTRATTNDHSVTARIVYPLPQTHGGVVLVLISLAKLNEVRKLVSCGDAALMLSQRRKCMQRWFVIKQIFTLLLGKVIGHPIVWRWDSSVLWIFECSSNLLIQILV